MSVLVKGVDMPENCCICWFSSHDMCLVCGKDADDWLEERPEYCPLVEIPDHGDLIDRDELKDKAEFIGDAFSGRGGFSVWGDDVINAPVVIPAERSKDE